MEFVYKLDGVLMIKCKIFKETYEGPEALQEQVYDYFEDMEDVIIVSMNTVSRKFNNIECLTIVVLYR